MIPRRSRVGMAGARGHREPECGEVWTSGCGAEKGGGPATQRRGEGLGCARCLWGMTGIKDGLSVVSWYRTEYIHYMDNDELGCWEKMLNGKANILLYND